MPSYQAHLRTLLLTVTIPLVLLLAFNLLVDPYAVFGLLSGTRFSRSASGLGSAIGKGEMLAKRDWDVLLLGTSRVEGGLEPEHPVFGGQRVYNAGLTGADFPELDRAARIAMKRGTLKHLVLGLDFFCFDPDWHPDPEAQQSLLNPKINPIDYHLSNLLSLRATRKSIATVDYAIHHFSGPEYPLGLIQTHPSPVKNVQPIWIAGGYLFLTLPLGIERSDRWPMDDSRFDALSKLLADAGRAGVKVDIVQLPMHAIGLESYFAADRWPLYERWVGTLTRIVDDHNGKFPNAPVTFWDFCNYDSFTTDPALNKTVWFYDPFHLTIPLGDLVLDRMMQFPPPAGTNLDGFGVIVTGANLESHLAKLRRDHQAYDDANPRMKEFHQMIRASLAARGTAGG